MSDTHSGIESLLEPSLGAGSGATAIYSVRACFFVAFFGGPFAILMFSALNSRRLGRLGRDAWAYVLGAIASVAFVVLITPLVAAGTPPEWLGWLGEGRRGLRYASRALAIVLFGLLFLLHRPYHRAAALRGLEAPSPWIPGIAVTVVGAIASIALVVAVVEMPDA